MKRAWADCVPSMMFISIVPRGEEREVVQSTTADAALPAKTVDSLWGSVGSIADTRVHVHHVGGNPVNQQVSCASSADARTDGGV